MKKLILYPKFQAKGKDFSKEKIMTVPNQAMTIQTIIERFTRGERLPVLQQGQYSTKFGDLEKLKSLDPTEKQERADELRQFVGREKDYNEKLKSEKIARIKAKRDKQKSVDPQDQPKP